MYLSSLPASLSERLVKQYGERAESIAEGFHLGRKTTFRVNRLKTTVGEISSLLTERGIPFEKCPWWEDAFLLAEGSEELLRALPAYEEGKIYLQSLSSMLPPLLVDPKEGERILDMTAAPGGKTTQMASLSGNKALVTACEKNKIRADKLAYNLKRQGASRSAVLVEDGAELSPFMSFDKILLDAPCSGSGTLLYRNERWEQTFSEKTFLACVKAQEKLLKKAVELVKKGGEIVYSTCSILQEENENALKKVLKEGKAELVPLDKGIFPTVPFLPTSIGGTLCVSPNENYEGFFVSKLKKIK